VENREPDRGDVDRMCVKAKNSLIERDLDEQRVSCIFEKTKRVFEETVNKARNAGLTPVERPRIFLSKTIVMKKGPKE